MATTERGDLMYKLSQLIEEHKETLATIETWDNGIINSPLHCSKFASLEYYMSTNHVSL
jgi:acyl-CoA reductase-like NAD-dependent aldehyde dehydrogenase